MRKLFIIPFIIFTTSIYAKADYETRQELSVGTFLASAHTETFIKTDIYNELTNNTGIPITIMAHYDMCIESCGCDKHQWTVKIAPFSTWHDHWRPWKECRFSTGHYRIDAQAVIDGIDISFRSEKDSYGNVNVM